MPEHRILSPARLVGERVRSETVEYDVEEDREAYERMLELSGGRRTVPVIVERGKPVQVDHKGQGCFV